MDAIHQGLTDLTDKADSIAWKELRRNFPSLTFDDRLSGVMEQEMSGAKTIWILQFETMRKNSGEIPLKVLWEQYRSLANESSFPLGDETGALHEKRYE